VLQVQPLGSKGYVERWSKNRFGHQSGKRKNACHRNVRLPTRASEEKGLHFVWSIRLAYEHLDRDGKWQQIADILSWGPWNPTLTRSTKGGEGGN
jgi:hypothetical protein